MRERPTLALKKETLADLAPDDLGQVVGGTSVAMCSYRGCAVIITLQQAELTLSG